jgi:nucleoside-diphosphate-sugar epimerase
LVIIQREAQVVTQTPMRLLVVGGNGFIGRHIVSHALGLGWQVTSLNLSQRHQGGEKSTAVRCVSGDITDSIALGEALGNTAYEYVVNCGGYIDHTLYLQGGRRILDTHFQGVLNLVESLDRNILQAFVNIGSSDEYGNSPAPQTETHREAPISPYSLGKVAATHFLEMLYRTEKFPAVTLRLFLTYGPGQDNRRFLPQIILGCLEGRSFPTSKGEQRRDFCYVEDTVSAVFAAFSSPMAKGQVVNVGSGQPVSIRQMIEIVRRLIGRGEPQYGEIAYRPGENMELYADISKAKALLGWEPKVSIETGLAKTIQWIRDQN